MSSACYEEQVCADATEVQAEAVYQRTAFDHNGPPVDLVSAADVNVAARTCCAFAV